MKFLSIHSRRLGGAGKIVQCDESVICRRGVIRSPTTTDDNSKDTVWILGCIDTTPEKNFFVTIMANRRIETIAAALQGIIDVGSILHTDGYPAYPELKQDAKFTTPCGEPFSRLSSFGWYSYK